VKGAVNELTDFFCTYIYAVLSELERNAEPDTARVDLYDTLIH